MIKIYVATQKPLGALPDRYTPLMVGRSDVEPNDASGDSISERNRFYCELTGHYWIWKNDLDSEIVGLCQYRRYLWLNAPPSRLCSQNFRSLDECRQHLDARHLERLLDDRDVILPRPYAFSHDNIETQFVRAHRQENFDLMLRSIERVDPDYMSTARKVFARRTEYLANLIIARKNVFDDYSRWLFDVLFDVERHVELNDDNARLPGYMAERLLNLYVAHNRLRVREVPLIFIGDAPDSSRIDLRYLKRRYFSALLDVEDFCRRKFKMR
ncbi:MAG: DUF4422 domain-containing protein [Selenomonadaceae bacterium]|nr:DUF4422 domain-containing protein [Selenomonadaceae bacterium]